MSPRTGRPKAEKPMCNDIKVRLSDEMNLQLVEYCKKYGLTKAEAIRKGLQKLLESDN